MTTRFVYPKYSSWKRETLLIAAECEDGYTWFGVRDAIKNYLDEYDLEISQVEWKIWIEQKQDYVSIVASSLDEWETEFNKLNIEW